MELVFSALPSLLVVPRLHPHPRHRPHLRHLRSPPLHLFLHPHPRNSLPLPPPPLRQYQPLRRRCAFQTVPHFSVVHSVPVPRDAPFSVSPWRHAMPFELRPQPSSS